MAESLEDKITKFYREWAPRVILLFTLKSSECLQHLYPKLKDSNQEQEI